MGDFFNSGDVLQDKNAKSLSYYFTIDVVRIDLEIVKQLRELSAKNGKCNARICLHISPTANFHEMIILEYGGYYYRPHKHLTKGESCHIIEGEVAFLIFNDNGAVEASNIMSKERNLISRVGINRWHTVIPITEYAIYHESKPGPYIGQGDSVYPDWAPDGSDSMEAQKYIEQLLDVAKKGQTSK